MSKNGKLKNEKLDELTTQDISRNQAKQDAGSYYSSINNSSHDLNDISDELNAYVVNGFFISSRGKAIESSMSDISESNYLLLNARSTVSDYLSSLITYKNLL